MVGHLIDLFSKYEFNGFEGNENANKLIYELIPSLLPSATVIKEHLKFYKVFCSSEFASRHPVISCIRSSLKETGMSCVDSFTYYHIPLKCFFFTRGNYSRIQQQICSTKSKTSYGISFINLHLFLCICSSAFVKGYSPEISRIILLLVPIPLCYFCIFSVLFL